MNIKNCRVCGGIFNYVVGEQICPKCKETREAKFQQVKAYLQENRGANIQNVADDCEVEPSLIKKWLREGRLELTEDSPLALSCEGCGARIRSGRFCDKCQYQVRTELTGLQPAKGAIGDHARRTPSAKMHFLDN